MIFVPRNVTWHKKTQEPQKTDWGQKRGDPLILDPKTRGPTNIAEGGRLSQKTGKMGRVNDRRVQLGY